MDFKYHLFIIIKLFLLVSFFDNQVFASNPGLRDKASKNIVCSPIVVFSDTSNLPFNKIKHQYKTNPSSFNTGTLNKDSVYWGHFSVENQSENQEILISFNNLISDFTYYQLTDGSLVATGRGGVLVSYNQRTNKKIRKDQLQISLPSNTKSELYLRIINHYEGTYSLDMLEIKPITFEGSENHSWWKGIFIGILLFLTLYNIILLFFTKSAISLTYTIYLVLSTLFFLSTYQLLERFFYPDTPGDDLYFYWSIFLAQYIYQLFLFQIFKRDNIAPNKFILTFSTIFGILTIATILISPFNYTLSLNIGDYITPLCLVFVAITSFKYFRIVSLTGKIILIGALMGIVGGVIMTVLNYRKYLLYDLVYLEYGLLAELIFFTIAVNYTYHKSQSDKMEALYKNSLLEIDTLKQEKKNRELQMEIDHQNRLLTAKAIKLSEKETLVKSVSDELKKIKNTSPEIDRIIRNLKISKNNSTWKEFEIHFNTVHPDFYHKLAERHPQLTVNEKRLCAYLKLNFSTKEIATITGKPSTTIDVSRSRLRKKLGLAPDTNLQTFISNI